MITISLVKQSLCRRLRNNRKGGIEKKISVQNEILHQKLRRHLTSFRTVMTIENCHNPDRNLLDPVRTCSSVERNKLQRMLQTKLLEHKPGGERVWYRGRECEHRGRRERDPLASFCGLGAWRFGNARWFGEGNRNRRASSGGILGIGTPPEHRRSCRQSGT